MKRCCVVVFLWKEGEDKETKFLQELNGRFRGLNLELEKKFWNYGINLDTTIIYWLAEKVM
jgi:hypothetical protein